MIHPDIELRFLSPEKGYGLFATRLIPKGTVTFVQDPLDISIPPASPLLVDETLGPIIERYSYQNARCERIVSWDHGKYMNHCCHANTLTTGYGFEIAIRDIEAGEEVTDDYGIFSVCHEMTIHCDKSQCRGRVSIDDFESCLPGWDAKVQEVLRWFHEAEQPLLPLIDAGALTQLCLFLEGKEAYVSVASQRVSVFALDNALQTDSDTVSVTESDFLNGPETPIQMA